MATSLRSRRGSSPGARTTGPDIPTSISRPSRKTSLHLMPDRSDGSWLAALLAPVSVDEFLANYWLQQHLFCRGARDRFAHLLSWTTLNEILNHHWRETYR